MPDWSEKHEQDALAAVANLKRVMGITNHPTRADAFEERHLHIFTPDEDSAVLLGELLYRYGTGNRAAFYKSHPEKITIRDTIQIKHLDLGGCEVTMWVPWPLNLIKAADKMVRRYAAPDKPFTR